MQPKFMRCDSLGREPGPRRSVSPAPMTRRLFLTSTLTVGVLAGCRAATAEPVPLLVGADTCAFCRMTILDERLAAEYVAGRQVVKFDEAGCLRDWVLRHDPGRAGVAWLRDYAGGGWVRAESAVLVAGAVATPMSTNVVAFRDEVSADRLVRERGGRRLPHAELLGAGARGGARYPLPRELPAASGGQGEARGGEAHASQWGARADRGRVQEGRPAAAAGHGETRR